MKSSLSLAPASSPSRVGRYELKAEVARGGMGVVYRAYDKLADREVAYKRLIASEARTRARFVALFQREYNTLAQLKHPAIVDVYEYGFDDQGPFYTMELLHGQGLLELSPLPVKEVCRVLRDTASALALLHARRVIHRDLSPANVRVEKDGRTKLIDFGALIPFGAAPDVVGTPAFMAPESFEGGKLDQRADLYALGALAYFALTRKTAVHARSMDDLPLAWLDPVVPPRMHLPELPKALEELVLSLLARDPLARPSSAAEVMERLSVIGELEPEPDAQRVASSYTAHPPLVGREIPLLHLEQALDGVMDERGACMLLEAEQGLGKSALLADLAVRAQLLGATVLRADAGADNGSFGLARALVRVATALYPELLPKGGKDSYFQQVLEPKRLVRVESAWSPVLASERQARTLALMQDILLRAADKNPLVIVIDELHRGDSESLALIAALANECRDHPLLLVLAANRGALASDAYLTIKSASRPIMLEALTVAHAQELTGAVFGGADNCQRLGNWLHERSGGNPARMMDLTRLLLQRQLIQYTNGAFALPHDVPGDVAWEDSAATLLGRLADLSALARKCAEALSLQEMPLRVEHLARTLRVETRETVLALEELSARGIVSVVDGRTALLSLSLRDALSKELPEEEQRGLHLKAARAILAEKQLDGSLRMHAGMHLLKAGEESEAVALLTARGDGDFLSGNTPVPLLEAVLDVLRRQGRRDEECLGVLVPLVRGGFFGDLDAQRRHINRTLTALANVCGVTTMARLTPKLGAKLAFILGLAGALFRHARTPKNMRYGTFPETVAALLSTLSATTAACACAFDARQAFEIVRRFEPLRGFGPDSAPYWSIEFCLATAEAGAARFSAARSRYLRLLERFKRPVKGMNEEIHLQFSQGILHGLAQSLVADTDPRSLKLAEELESAHMFFAPHANVVRMGFYGYRGQLELSEQHRRRAEMLALRGGISWSSATLMTARAGYMALAASDVVSVVRAIAEFERLATTVPKALLYRDAMNAGIALLRGQPQQAITAYQRLFQSPDAIFMFGYATDRVQYAKALGALGRHAEAKQVCEELLSWLGDELIYLKKGALQQLALTQAALGDLAGASKRLDDVIELLKPFDNPIWSGLAHRDRAKVALFANEQASFEQHLRAMTELFLSTKYPALIQQCDLLRTAAQAQARGARSTRALEETALAFETSQSHMHTVDDMDRFETEAISGPAPANDQTG